MVPSGALDLQSYCGAVFLSVDLCCVPGSTRYTNQKLQDCDAVVKVPNVKLPLKISLTQKRKYGKS